LHFRDVRDLLDQTTGDILRAFRSVLYDTLEVPLFSEEGVQRYVHIFEHLAQYGEWYRLFLAELPQSDYAAAFRRNMYDILLHFSLDAMRAVQPDDTKLTAPRPLAAHFQASGFLGLVTWWLQQRMPCTPRYLAEHMVKLRTIGPYLAPPDLGALGAPVASMW
ncbi:MAG: TetR family transcriptional regulator C-terminal domain-containing protein, partial [Alicyclobacillus sp.]|nr:TetR family transcriptional regulator C-terminal domain-containing protein [Alicyclobacillus sp.]